jgi:nitrogen fixation protein NifB
MADANFKATPPVIPDEVAKMTAKHPCYSFDAQHEFARMHLPVAPICNISCNYCNRKYDCAHESRPGVTSEVLSPEMSREKFIRVRAAIPQLSVVGIAGPGDALANWEAVKRSIELIRDEAADMIFCLSTNGLMLPRYAADIVALGVRHVTVTVNCLEPAVGAKIYRHIHYQGKYYVGERAAEILIRNQLEGIGMLAGNGILVKVNIVMLKDINDGHIPKVVSEVKNLGALMTNIMPLIPAPGSVFQDFPQTSMKEVNAMRNRCQTDLTQMRHCRQCRADAIGLLGEDQSYRFRGAKPDTGKKCSSPPRLYKVAVTSKYKTLVDLHYGHAESFHIYETDGRNNRFVETRSVRKYCSGGANCDESDEIKNAVVQSIVDCDALLTMRIGHEAQRRLAGNGVFVVEYCDSVVNGLLHVSQQLRRAEDSRVTVCSGV